MSRRGSARPAVALVQGWATLRKESALVPRLMRGRSMQGRRSRREAQMRQGPVVADVAESAPQSFGS